MFFKKSPEKFWNLIASKYAASPISDKSAYEAKILKLKTLLTPEMTVLDVGCATGTQCGDIADGVKNVMGIDISNKLLSIARQRMEARKIDNVEFLQTSIFDKRLQKESYDVVMAFFVLHFFEDIDAVIKRVHELLRPGGIFISETACLGDKGKLLGSSLRVAGHLGFIPKINPLTMHQLENSFKNTGFNMTEKIKFSERSDAEFTMFARKPGSL